MMILLHTFLPMSGKQMSWYKQPGLKLEPYQIAGQNCGPIPFALKQRGQTLKNERKWRKTFDDDDYWEFWIIMFCLYNGIIDLQFVSSAVCLEPYFWG